jgi:hypothetical protein
MRTREAWRYSSINPNIGCSWRQVINFTFMLLCLPPPPPVLKTPVSTEWGVGWTPCCIWTLQKNLLPLTGNELCPPAPRYTDKLLKFSELNFKQSCSSVCVVSNREMVSLIKIRLFHSFLIISFFFVYCKHIYSHILPLTTFTFTVWGSITRGTRCRDFFSLRTEPQENVLLSPWNAFLSILITIAH